MARLNDEKLKMMEDEMTRFEAEIALPVIPPSLTAVAGPRHVIGAGTYTQVQRQLEEQRSGVMPPEFAAMGPPVGFPPLMSAMQPYPGLPPPPPPPPPVFIPHQVQRPGPMRPPMRPPMALGPPMMPGPAPPPPAFMGPPQPGPPPFMGPMVTIQQVGQPVLSGAALIYNPKNLTGDATNAVHTQEELDDNRTAKKKLIVPEKPVEPIIRAKDMAEKVKATTVVSITPNADEVVPPTTKKKEKKNKKPVRTAGGQIWEDHSLLEWEDDDFRIFCGDLGNDVTDEILSRAFGKYQSFLKAKVVRDKRTNKTKGYGFVSFKDPQDFIKAMKEMNGRYVGSRPIKLRKSCWKSRNLDSVRKREKEKAALVGLLTGR